jgi:hypothetical protein
MDHRTTSGRTARRTATPRRPLLVRRRPGLLLATAAAGAVLVNVALGTEPAAEAEAATTPVSVADELGLTARSGAVDGTEDLDPLEDLVASRSSREAAETAAQKAQAKADRAELEKQKAEERAKARAAAKKAAAKEAAAKEAAAKEAAPQDEAADDSAEPSRKAPAPPAAEAASSTAVDAIARISNTSGPVSGATQAAANAVVSNVSGAGSITLGGTRPSAADPAGHPSGNALDYMVLGDTGLGNAIVQYHIAHWDELGVDYLIYQQRYLGSPGGSWSAMEDRGSPTANHYDHVHVNYR